jgi:uncharacterized protein DUF4282
MKDTILRDIFFFDNMLTPKVITFVYWVLLLVAIIGGIGSWFVGFGFTFMQFLTGLGIIIGGVVGARISCELLIVLFKMNEALQELRNK